ncbi:MAG: large protein [Verrucomicrobia bacterium]|jgi:plastocyanin|nr:large protein [Verrucomicrobiota bacterium]
MTSRCKVWAALWVVLLVNVFAGGSLHAATFYVDVNASSMTPSSLSIIPGDTVVFTAKKNNYLYLDGAPMFGGVLFLPNDSGSHVFSSEGTFVVRGSNQDHTYCVITSIRPVNAAPAVSITNLALRIARPLGSNVTFRTSAIDEDGTVTKVEYRQFWVSNGVTVTNILTTSTVSPYTFVWSNSIPGKYEIQARAYDDLAVFANSLRVNLSLYTPFTNTLPAITNVSGVNNVVFRFNTDTGLVYVVEVTTNLVNWLPVSTNTATNNLIQVLDPNVDTLTNRFYRIRLVP